MKLEQQFEVKAPLAEVWAALIDVERVAPCLPGAEITEAGEDGTYRGSFQVKLGPTTASYRGTLKVESLDEDAHRVTMAASGQDKRGQGSAKATIVSDLSESAGVTTVSVDTNFIITGRLARFGRSGMIEDISRRLMRDFSDCLQSMIEAGGAQAAPAVEAPGEAGAAPVPGAEAAPPEGAAGTAEGAPFAVPPPTGAPAEPAGGEASGGGRPPAPRSAPAPAKPVKGLSLLLSVLWDRLRALVRRLLERVRGGR